MLYTSVSARRRSSAFISESGICARRCSCSVSVFTWRSKKAWRRVCASGSTAPLSEVGSKFSMFLRNWSRSESSVESVSMPCGVEGLKSISFSETLPLTCSSGSAADIGSSDFQSIDSMAGLRLICLCSSARSSVIGLCRIASPCCILGDRVCVCASLGANCCSSIRTRASYLITIRAITASWSLGWTPSGRSWQVTWRNTRTLPVANTKSIRQTLRGL